MSKAINFEEVSKQLAEEHNKVRANPSSYIEKLENSIKYFRGEVIMRPGEDPIQTAEGKEAFLNAIEFLKNQQPVPAMILDERLSQACKDHTEDIGPKGVASHEGSNGNSVSDRIEKYCEWDGSCCENIDFGTKQAENIIINLLVDDGITDRLQRLNLFNPDLKFFGVAVGKHKDYGTMAVMNYVAGVRNLGEESSDTKNFIQDYIAKMSQHKETKDKPKNAFQKDDPDAPDNTMSVKIVKTTKNIKGKEKKITRKIYSLDNNTQHIVEIEDTA